MSGLLTSSDKCTRFFFIYLSIAKARTAQTVALTIKNNVKDKGIKMMIQRLNCCKNSSLMVTRSIMTLKNNENERTFERDRQQN